ncbi:MAG: phage minor tail protein L [Flavobacteriaceae bacterium]
MPINDKISKDLIDVEPTAILEFYRLYYDTVNEPSTFFPFHPCSHGITGKIKLNNISYVPLAVEVEDFESNIFNRIARPRLRVSNAGLLVSDLLRKKSDFKNAKIERIKIFIKYIDNSNFDGGVNPFGIADPNAEIVRDTFIISQKLQENKELVEFELTAPFDLENFEIPGRLIMGRYCYWQYRGIGCNYYGRPVCQENDAAFTYIPTGNAAANVGDFFNASDPNYEWQNKSTAYNPGDIVYVLTEKDPFKTFYICKNQHIPNENNHPTLDASPWEKDGCSKLIGACRKRFANTGIYYTGLIHAFGADSTGAVTVLNTVPIDLAGESQQSNFSLPFGGFPATDKYSYGPSFKNK